MIRVTCLVVILCLLSFSSAASIQWTGGAGNSLWGFANNWLGNAVPTASDDVIINALGGVSVSVSQPAVARSITIAGGQYAQSLILLSQLVVGSGGVTVGSGGTLQVQNNNDLPLSSSGPVNINAGGVFVFQSGAISGNYFVKDGGLLSFSQSALKLLSAANLINNGTATIQSSTIQLTASSTFINNGNTTVTGTVTILRDPSDKTTNAFQNNGGFSYQGNSDSSSLNLQLPTIFTSPLEIISGNVAINDFFNSTSSISIPAASVLTVGAGTSSKYFNVLKGTGILQVQGIAQVNAPVSLSVFIVSDSGSLHLDYPSSFNSASVGGVLTANAAVTLTNLTLAGGTLTGPGYVSVSGWLEITSSDTGNTNNFLSTTLVLYGNGQSTAPIYLLLGQGGQWHIAKGATYNILNSFNFGIQSGKPLVIVDGTLGLTLSGSQPFTSNVDFSGSGSLKVNSGKLIFSGDTVTLGTLSVAVNSFIDFQTVIVTIGTLSGTGGVNLTAAPSPVSSISTVALSTLSVINGNVNVGNLALQTLNLWSGVVTLASASSNSATNVNVYGGSLSGGAKFSVTALNLNLLLPFTLNGVAIKTTSFSFQASGTGTLQLTGGATIIADSSLAVVSRNNVNIN